MFNQIVLVGKCLSIFDDNKEKITLKISIPRGARNSENKYIEDIITCHLLGSIADNTREYLKTNSLIGIKGKLEESNDTGSVVVVANKVTLLGKNINKES